MANERYNIFCKGKALYSNLTEEEYMDAMEDLAQTFYGEGSPHPDEIETKIIGD